MKATSLDNRKNIEGFYTFLETHQPVTANDNNKDFEHAI